MMRKYRCHKEVQAGKIVSIEPFGSSWALRIEGEEELEFVGHAWCVKHDPKVGGYYVSYADGYTSYSPAEAFESGYTLVPEAAAPTLICDFCGADRYKEPCGSTRLNCPMSGVAAAAGE
jgi:hypothetical protein